VVLLLIGVNDFGLNNDTAHAINRLQALIEHIAALEPYAKIIVANLLKVAIPSNPNEDSLIQSQYNSAIPGIVANEVASGRQVSFLDLRSCCGTGDFANDGLHPNQSGLAKMGETWFPAITSVISPLGTANAPAVLRAEGQVDLKHVVVTFSKPIADNSANTSHFSLNGGLSVLGASLDASMRVITLTTSVQTPLTAYTLTVNGIQDRTPQQNLIAAGTTVTLQSGPAAEAANYTLVYSVPLPTQADFNAVSVPYEVDNHATVDAFSRIAYYLQLLPSVGAAPQDIWVSMNAFTTDPGKIGIPTFQSGALFQQPLTNMNVRSSVSGVVTGDGLSGGNIEFWPANYEPPNAAHVPNASDAVDDWGDTVSSTVPDGYGSMQVHDSAQRQVLFAYNGWGDGGQMSDLGIGNYSGGNPDWTFAENADGYVARKLQVYVLPIAGVHVLTVSSVNPSSGVNITMSPADTTGQASGLSELGRFYNQGTVVSLTAPASGGGGTIFQKWQKDGVDYGTGRSTSILMDTSHTLRAVYVSGADATSYVTEAANYSLVYSLLLPSAANYTVTGVPYEIDNHVSTGTGSFSRIAYFVELQDNNPFRYLWVSMDAFTNNASLIGVPTLQSGALFQQFVNNMNVRSSVSGVVNGDGITTGNVEFWPYGYHRTNSAHVPGASDSDYDFGDEYDSGTLSGSMQVHNYGAAQTLFAFNEWATADGSVDIGIGNDPTGLNPDWTFAGNGGTYTLKKLQVYVLPVHTLTVNSVNPAAGASITDSPADNNGAGNGSTPFARTYNHGTVVTLTAPASVGGQAFVQWQRDGADLTTSLTATVTMNGDHTLTAIYDSRVVGAYVFYNNSAWDGNDPAANANDDNAIAIDKTPLLPGGVASFANYTSYSRGINGIMVDIAGLPGTLTVSDFVFKVGNDNNPSAWSTAPSPTSINIRNGAGANRSARVTLIWPDNTIQKKWLQVTVLANAHSGLDSPYVFYFGNAIGDAGNVATDAVVDPADELLARANPRNLLNPAPIDSPYDYNRDRNVDPADQLIARANQTSLVNALQLIDLSSAGPAAFILGTPGTPPKFRSTSASDLGPDSASDSGPRLPRLSVSLDGGTILVLQYKDDSGQLLRLQMAERIPQGAWVNVPLSADVSRTGLVQWRFPVDQRPHFFRIAVDATVSHTGDAQ
jgi:hypothetical protein